MTVKELIGRELGPEEDCRHVAATVYKNCVEPVVGTCAAIPMEDSWKAHLFCRARNLLLKKGIIKGFNGILFISRVLYEQTGGYNPEKNTFEHIDLIKRALAQGGRWVYLEDVYVQWSMRRYEQQGYLKTFCWWIVEAMRHKSGLSSRKQPPL